MLRLQPAMLYQALRADGQLVIAGPEELSAGSQDRYLRREEPMHLLRRLQRRARPWREAVKEWAERQPDGVLAELLLGLQEYRVDLRQLVQDCGGGRLEELLPPALRRRVVQLGGRRYVENAGGWYAVRRHGQEVLLTDAILRIDEISVGEQGLHYQGRIVFKGEEIPYAVTAATLERHPVQWLREYLLRQGKGLAYFAPGWRDVIALAVQWHEPLTPSAAQWTA
jgi:hypothetical protein